MKPDDNELLPGRVLSTVEHRPDERQAGLLDRQWFYDGLPRDADDTLYEVADAIYENVRAALAAQLPAQEERALADWLLAHENHELRVGQRHGGVPIVECRSCPIGRRDEHPMAFTRALRVEPSQMPCVVDGTHSDDLAHAHSVEAGTHRD